MTLIRFTRGACVYVEVEVEESMRLLGARRCFDWIDGGGDKGSVITRPAGMPLVCTHQRHKHLVTCSHRTHVRDQLNSPIWDAPLTEPAA